MRRKKAGYASAKTLNMRVDSMLIRIRMWLTRSLIDRKGNTNEMIVLPVEIGPSSAVQDDNRDRQGAYK